jgi:hypothetical protein
LHGFNRIKAMPGKGSGRRPDISNAMRNPTVTANSMLVSGAG